MKDNRDYTLENPGTSALFKESPLKEEHEGRKTHKTDMCPFNPQPDGKRHKKLTRLDSSKKLIHSVRKCQMYSRTCTFERIQC